MLLLASCFYYLLVTTSKAPVTTSVALVTSVAVLKSDAVADICAITSRLETIAIRLEAIATRFSACNRWQHHTELLHIPDTGPDCPSHNERSGQVAAPKLPTEVKKYRDLEKGYCE